MTTAPRTAPSRPLTPEQEDILAEIRRYTLQLKALKYVTRQPGESLNTDNAAARLRGKILSKTAQLRAGPWTQEVARRLAAMGRGGDSEIAHVTPGEMVLHPSQLSPETLARVVHDLARRGIGVGRVSVGSADAPRNPHTGAAEFDPTPSPPQPGLPTYWVQEPNGQFPGMVRPIPDDQLNGFVAGAIPNVTVPRPDLSPPRANWGNQSDPYGAWGRVMQGTGPMPIGRSTPPSDAAATGGLINYRQNLLPPGWTAPDFGPPRNEKGEVVTASGPEASEGAAPSPIPGSPEWARAWIKAKEGDPFLKYQLDPLTKRTVVGGYGHDLGESDEARAKLGMLVSQEEADRMYNLDYDAKSAATQSKFTDDAWKKLNPMQQSMLKSLAYNVGANAFDRTRLQSKINAGDLVGAAQEWLEFNNITTIHRNPPHEDIRLKLPDPTMSKRRLEEVGLFLGPDIDKLTLPPYYRMIMTPQVPGPGP